MVVVGAADAFNTLSGTLMGDMGLTRSNSCSAEFESDRYEGHLPGRLPGTAF